MADNIHARMRYNLNSYALNSSPGPCITRSASRTNSPGPRLNIKTVLSTYGDFHVKDKTAVRTSYL